MTLGWQAGTAWQTRRTAARKQRAMIPPIFPAQLPAAPAVSQPKHRGVHARQQVGRQAFAQQQAPQLSHVVWRVALPGGGGHPNEGWLARQRSGMGRIGVCRQNTRHVVPALRFPSDALSYILHVEQKGRGC